MRGFTRQVQKSIGQCAAQAKERGRTTQDAEKTAAGTKREERSALPPRGLGWRDSSRPSAGRQRGRVAGWAARLTLKQFFALPRNPLARRRIFSLRILSSTRAPTTTFRPSLWASGRFWMRIANFRAGVLNAVRLNRSRDSESVPFRIGGKGAQNPPFSRILVSFARFFKAHKVSRAPPRARTSSKGRASEQRAGRDDASAYPQRLPAHGEAARRAGSSLPRA